MTVNPPRITDWLQKRLTLFSFFKSGKSKIIYCKNFPTANLIPHLMDFQNPFEQLHKHIEYAINLDLEYIDTKLEQGYQLAHDTEWIEDWNKVRQTLKFGYLLKNIKEKGQLSPMQLILGSQENKYAIHPGSVRVPIVMTALELETCDLIYCWDKNLDNHPFILDYDFVEITNTKDFLSLYQKDLMVYREILRTDKLQPQVGATELQTKLLVERKFKDHKYDFLTTFDQFELKVEKRVKFSEVFKFHSDTECTIAGINFIKEGMWIRQ